MAAKLRSNHATERLVVSVGDFETHEFEPTRFDAVFSATAYHWISKNAQVDRPAELLTPGGVLAVVDLIQVDSPDDEGFFAAAQPIYDKYGQPHTGPTAPVRNNVDPTIRSTLAADTRFHNVAVDQFDWNQTYTAEQYRKLMLSYSVTQMMNEPQRTGLLDEIEALIQRDFGDSIITRPLVVTLTTAFLG